MASTTSLSWRVWRVHWLRWLLPAVLLLIVIGLFAFYQYAYAGQVEALESRFEAASATLDDLRTQRETVESYLSRLQRNDVGVEVLYHDHFATESQRFTRAIATVKALAERAGLRPDAFNYPDETLDEFELIERKISFQVSGRYDQLRTFINLLELSDQFLILEQIGLGGNNNARAVVGDPNLGINFGLSTVFSTDDAFRRAGRELADRRAAEMLRAQAQSADDAAADDGEAAGDDPDEAAVEGELDAESDAAASDGAEAVDDAPVADAG